MAANGINSKAELAELKKDEPVDKIPSKAEVEEIEEEMEVTTMCLDVEGREARSEEYTHTVLASFPFHIWTGVYRKSDGVLCVYSEDLMKPLWDQEPARKSA